MVTLVCPSTHQGVSRAVYKGLQELLKYFIQCIEQDYRRDPDGVIFSAFLVFRLAFSTFQKTSSAQRGSPSVSSSDKLPSEKPRSLFGTPVDVSTPTPNMSQKSLAADSLEFGVTPMPEDSTKPDSTPVGPRRYQATTADTTRHPLVAESKQFPSGLGQSPQVVANEVNVKDTVTTPSTISTSTPASFNVAGAGSFSLISGPLFSFYSPSTPSQEEVTLTSSLPISVPPLHRKLTSLYQRMQSQASLTNSPRILDSSDTENLKHEGSFLYKGLVKALDGNQTLLLNKQFWNVLFMSTVHTDRTLMGWNEQTSELYTR